MQDFVRDQLLDARHFLLTTDQLTPENGMLTATLKLTRPSASLLGALALTNFTIASPAALEEFGADEGVEGLGAEVPPGVGILLVGADTDDPVLVVDLQARAG